MKRLLIHMLEFFAINLKKKTGVNFREKKIVPE